MTDDNLLDGGSPAYGIAPRGREAAADHPRSHREAPEAAATPQSAAEPDGSDGADPADPYRRERQTFPRLDDEAIERIKRYGREETLADGTVLFERGDRTVDFFLVLSGAIEILDRDEDGAEVVVAVHAERNFTGELDLFNANKILVGGRTRGETRLVRLERQAFRRLLAGEPDIGETITRALILRRTGFIMHAQAGAQIVGARNDGETLRIERFLRRNGYPVEVIDPASDRSAAQRLMDECHGTVDGLPKVVTADGVVLARPSNKDLAHTLGLTETIDEDRVYDVAVVGAGPSGLSAAVYAASEGLDTLIVEMEAPGGQAGTSSKIENYLGFPTGISGQALAGRAWIQSQKFGATLVLACPATGLDCDGPPFRVAFSDGVSARARSVVVATGATYRKLDLANYERFEGQGIHYAATAIESDLCRGSEAAVVGGGNSAGQAAVFLSRFASHVHVLVRSDKLAASMSDYLVQRIEASPQITLHTSSEITELHGDEFLEAVTFANRETGEAQRRPITNVFVMIGAVPNAGWVADCVEIDERGFVRTGTEVTSRRVGSAFETSQPGVFAVGDVRSGSVKRVASGVGEGSVCIQAVHKHLAERVGPSGR
ncbi:FAD-dependent oxidoreductase [Acuticoccus sp.]|uniref:FAD-dependent oxidoreductase n=1 Tax=Acuticoccus sp. TaxID=1904378 RepID=UPI003B528FAF